MQWQIKTQNVYCSRHQCSRALAVYRTTSRANNVSCLQDKAKDDDKPKLSKKKMKKLNRLSVAELKQVGAALILIYFMMVKTKGIL